MLRLHPEGRHALTDDQKTAANWIGGTLGCALLALGLAFAFDRGWLLIASLVLGLFAIPLAGRFKCADGWSRRVMTAVCLLLAVLGLTAVILSMGGLQPGALGRELGIAVLGIYALGSVLTTWLAGALMAARPTR